MYFFPQEFTVMFHLITLNIAVIILRTSLKGFRQASMGGGGDV